MDLIFECQLTKEALMFSWMPDTPLSFSHEAQLGQWCPICWRVGVTEGEYLLSKAKLKMIKHGHHMDGWAVTTWSSHHMDGWAVTTWMVEQSPHGWLSKVTTWMVEQSPHGWLSKVTTWMVEQSPHGAVTTWVVEQPPHGWLSRVTTWIVEQSPHEWLSSHLTDDWAVTIWMVELSPKWMIEHSDHIDSWAQ